MINERKQIGHRIRLKEESNCKGTPNLRVKLTQLPQLFLSLGFRKGVHIYRGGTNTYSQETGADPGGVQSGEVRRWKAWKSRDADPDRAA